MTDVATNEDEASSAERDHKLIEDFQNSDDFQAQLKIARGQRSIVLAERSRLRELAERERGPIAKDLREAFQEPTTAFPGAETSAIALEIASFNQADEYSSDAFTTAQVAEVPALSQPDAAEVQLSDEALAITQPTIDGNVAETSDQTALVRSVETGNAAPIGWHGLTRTRGRVAPEQDINFAPIRATPKDPITTWPLMTPATVGTKPPPFDNERAIGVTRPHRSMVAVGLAIGLPVGMAAGLLIFPVLNLNQVSEDQPEVVREVAIIPPNLPPVDRAGTVDSAGSDLGTAGVTALSVGPSLATTPPVEIALEAGVDTNTAQESLTAPEVQYLGPSQILHGRIAQEPSAVTMRTDDPGPYAGKPMPQQAQLPQNLADRSLTAQTAPGRVLAVDQAAPQSFPVGPTERAAIPTVQPGFSAPRKQIGAGLALLSPPDLSPPQADQPPILPPRAPTLAAETYQANLHVTQVNAGRKVVAQLRDLGVLNTTVVVQDFALAQTTVAYYHARDAATAQLMATLLNGDAMDMTGVQPPPQEGTVDIYLKD